MEKGINNWEDILVLSLYGAFTIGIAIWASSRKGRESVKGYCLAGRSMSWFTIGLSLFSSNIGVEHFIGLAGEAAMSGLAVVAFQWAGVIHLLLLGWVFVPVYLLFGVYTVPEFLERRFGGTRLRLYFSGVSILVYIICKIAVSVFAGAMFIQQTLGWSIYLSIICILAITAVFTIIGGLRAVMYTDVLQSLVILAGALTLTVLESEDRQTTKGEMEKGINNWEDILVLSLYGAFTIGIAIWASSRKGRESVKGYCLAGRSMSWFTIGLSLFSSNIGVEHFIGLAGEAAMSGLAVVAFQWAGVIHLLLLGWVFVPVYLLFGVYTVPEFLERRFGGTRLRLYFSGVSILVYIICKIAVSVFAGAMFIQQTLGWSIYLSIICILAITAVFTIIGGLRAVMYTDVLQSLVILAGALTLTVLGLMEVGGVTALEYKYSLAVPTRLNRTNNATVTSIYNATATVSTVETRFYTLNDTQCGMPREDFVHLFRDADSSDYPWPSLAIQTLFGAMWYFCADQLTVQRTLSAKDIRHARGGIITAGYLHLLPLVIMVVPGMVSRILYTDEVACVDPEICQGVCDIENGCSSIAYSRLVLGIAPYGVRGLMIAAMLAGMTSSLTSVFHSAATIFSLDIWKTFRKLASETELLIIARLFMVLLALAGMGCVALVRTAEGYNLFTFVQTTTGYLAPPIVSSFFLSVFVPWTTEQGVFWSMIIGHAGGVARLTLDFLYPEPKCGRTDERPDVVVSMKTAYVSAVLLIVCTCLTILISLCTRKKSRHSVLHYWTVHNSAVRRRKLPASLATDPGMAKRHEHGYDDEINEHGDVAFRRGNPQKFLRHVTVGDRLRKMKLGLGWSLFININALVLLCVLVFLVIVFK